MTEEKNVSPYEFEEEKDMNAFRADPSKASEGMQRKYIGMTPEEYDLYFSSLRDEEGDTPEGFKDVPVCYTNPYTHEEKIIRQFQELPAMSDDEVIALKVKELKMKLINGTITSEEKETLRLLVNTY